VGWQERAYRLYFIRCRLVCAEKEIYVVRKSEVR